jgi:hypothetical protein
MLVDFYTRKPITKTWFPAKFRTWKSRLTARECDAINAEINRMVDANKVKGKSIVTTSWLPGADWTNTPFEPIFAKAAKRSETQAAQCFGLFVQEVFLHRPETWTSEHFEKDGVPLTGRTYFEPKNDF